MTDTGQANRRIHARRRAHVPARLAHGTLSAEGTVENVGAGGVFFATEDLELALDEGTAVRLSFDGRRGDLAVRIERPGTVLRTERYFDGRGVVRAFAVKFDDPLALDGIDFD